MNHKLFQFQGLKSPSQMTNVGYARVSTLDQNPELQLDALREFGCSKIFEEQASGGNAERPQLKAALSYLREGDTLVVWKLDRLGRNLSDLIKIIKALEISRIGFKSLQEGFVDTSSPWGNLIFQIFAAFAEFELNIIRERTHAGLKSARARGRVGGRRKKLVEADVLMLKALSQNEKLSITDICKRMQISRATYYRYLSPHASLKSEHPHP